MLKFTKKGKIEVRKGGILLSSHTTDTEAYEKISSHSDANGPAKYVVSYPTVEVDAMPITIVSKDTLPELLLEFIMSEGDPGDVVFWGDNPPFQVMAGGAA
jgi:hypothetical protein